MENEESRGSYTFIKQCILEVQIDNKTKSCNDKGISHQENITIINIYIYNRAHKYIKKILTDLNGEITKIYIIIVDKGTK